MADQNKDPKETKDIKNLEQTQDFEMGEDDASDEENKPAQNIIPAASPKPQEPKHEEPAKAQPTNPTPAPAPQVIVAAPQNPQIVAAMNKAQQSTASTQTQSSTQAIQTQPPVSQKPGVPNIPKGPTISKNTLLGCVGAFGAILMILLVLSFVFLAQSGKDGSPIAKMLGLDQASFVNSLITFIHIIFIISALIAFSFTMVGLFRMSMVKKGDDMAKKQAINSSILSGIILLIILMIWVFVYIYLDSKRIQVGPVVNSPIVTEPVDTLNLSAPIEVKFKAENIVVKSGNKIAFYDWNFGDDEKGTGAITSHIYKNVGEYTVTLSITLADKNTNQMLEDKLEYSRVVTISDEKLQAIFTATPESGEVPLEVIFDAKDSADPNGNIAKYEWDLNGDNQYTDKEGVTFTNKFEKVGKYKISLRITNTLGEYNTFEKEITVNEAVLPVAVITILDEPKRFLNNIKYTFKADDSTSPNGNIDKYEWDFGDGTKPIATKSAVHSFAGMGTYEVTLMVTDETGKQGETTKTIIIGAPEGTPKADFTTDPAKDAKNNSLKGNVPLVVKFDASRSTDSDNNIVDYEWDFGSGKIEGYGEQISHTFDKVGTYTVTLSVVDANKNTGRKTMIIEVEKQGIKADIKADKLDGPLPLTVTFDASGSTYPDSQIASFKWDFGDGTSQIFGNAQPTHKFTAIGTYTVSVTAIGVDNTSDTEQIIITVREVPLKSCFVSTFENGPAPLITKFDPSCSTGTITKYFWDFGDGATSTDIKPTHTYNTAGDYRATLEVSDNDNNVNKSEVRITVTAP